MMHNSPHTPAGGRHRESARRFLAFSLIEMLVVISIIAILIAITVPAMSASRRAGLNLKCVSQMQRAGFEFRMFADDFSAASRGESDALGPGRFHMDDFLDNLYRVDEFWDIEPAPRVQYEANSEVMMCPAGPNTLYRRPHITTVQAAVWPPAAISMAGNRRLWRDGTSPGIATVNSKILDEPNVPVILDVDGAAATDAGVSPYFIAPPVDPGDDYDSGQFWYPALRHGGKLNVAFVGGHVASSRTPERERSWNWGYHP